MRKSHLQIKKFEKKIKKISKKFKNYEICTVFLFFALHFIFWQCISKELHCS
jgi:hypothetical protein